MNKYLAKALSLFIASKHDRKLFKNIFIHSDFLKNEKESTIKNLANLLSLSEDPKILLSKDLALIEIEVFSYCNRQCWFCPNSNIDRHSQNKYMDENLYMKIINELSEINYSGIVSYSRYNEPFSDEIILTRLKYARKKLRYANLYTHTNGDYLTKELLKKLEQSGINTIRIQYYMKKDEKYEKNIILQKMIHRSKAFCDSYSINYFNDYYVELKIKNRNIDIIYQAINFTDYACNRGEALNIKMDYKRKTPCFIPFANMYIDYNGLVLPCCNMRSDIAEHKKFIVGDTNLQHLWDIFSGLKYINIRKKLLQNNITISPCSSCDFSEGFIPQTLSGENKCL